MQHGVRNIMSQSVVGPLLGLLGGTLGMLAGMLELTIGPTIRSWVGNKENTTGLGILTIVLSLVAFTAAVHAYRQPDVSAVRRLVRVLLLLIPAGICFTTVGPLWYIPGPLLIASAVYIALGHAVRREVS